MVTSRSLLVDPTTGEQVSGDSVLVDAGPVHGARTVERIQATTSAANDMAVLHLTAPVPATPFPLGYATLVRIGDEVRAPAPLADAETEWTLRAAVVDRLDVPAGHDPRSFRVALALPASSIGAPVINDLNEVVGMITAFQSKNATGAAISILGVDALDVILATIGFDRDR